MPLHRKRTKVSWKHDGDDCCLAVGCGTSHWFCVFFVCKGDPSLPALSDVQALCSHPPRSTKAGSNQHAGWTTCQKCMLRLSCVGHESPRRRPPRKLRGHQARRQRCDTLQNLTTELAGTKYRLVSAVEQMATHHTSVTAQSHEIMFRLTNQMVQMLS